MNIKKIILNGILPIAILAGAFQFCGYMKATAPKAPKEERVDLGLLVQTEAAARKTAPVTVTAAGRVKPARLVVIQPEISGTVHYVNPKMVLGGQIDAGDELVRLDKEQYALQVLQSSAQVTQAKFALEVEKGHQAVAKREWELLGSGAKRSTGNKSLALREPHLKLAKANVAAARSGLKRAQLNVKRASLRAPFNAFIKVDNVEMGQLAGPQSQLATLVGTDAFWIEATVPVARLKWLDVPGVNGFNDAVGSPVKVIQRLSDGDSLVRDGHVVRLLSELDATGVQARLIVEVVDPLLRAAGAQADGDLPLLLGSFVGLEIRGHDIDDAISVPRIALRDGDTVWVATKDLTLDIRRVVIAWRTKKAVLVSEGLEPGDQIVVSPIGTPVQGMKLRRPDAAHASGAGAETNTAPKGASDKTGNAVANGGGAQ